MNENTAERNRVEILIVEDSPTQAEQLKYMLEKRGFKASIASNGKEALASLRSHKPDIVITDIVMPEMNGYELCRQTRKDLDLHDMPVVLVTALTDPTEVVKGLEAGANTFITKPYDEKYLISRIEYLMANKSLRKDQRDEAGINVFFSGEKCYITAERLQILDFLLSTYENAYLHNRDLLAAQAELTKLNERLEETVEELEKAQLELRGSRDQLEVRVQERTAELRAAYEKLVEETKERELVEQQLRQAQKMEAVGTLAGGIAHDFNNILAAILGNAEIAMDALPEESKARHNVGRILKGSLRARELVKQILSFSRKDERERKRLRLGPVIEETFSLLRASIPATIEIKLDFSAENDNLYGDPSQLEQVILNLATNARDAMREKGGTLSVSVSNISFDGQQPDPDMQSGQYLMVAVKDTGCGMAEDVQQRIFEPFFTTKEQGQGTGLGLAVAYGIVKGYNGAITVSSRAGEGSVFRVFLPTIDEAGEAEGEEEALVIGGHERILFVDDEPALVEVAEEALSGLGYKVTAKTDPLEALEVFLEDPDGYDMVVTDQTMPEMTGLELVQRLLQVRPDIPTVLCTGYSESVSKEDAEKLGVRAFVMKPLSRKELAGTMRRVLNKGAA